MVLGFSRGASETRYRATSAGVAGSGVFTLGEAPLCRVPEIGSVGAQRVRRVGFLEPLYRTCRSITVRVDPVASNPTTDSLSPR